MHAETAQYLVLGYAEMAQYIVATYVHAEMAQYKVLGLQIYCMLKGLST